MSKIIKIDILNKHFFYFLSYLEDGSVAIFYEIPWKTPKHLVL